MIEQPSEAPPTHAVICGDKVELAYGEDGARRLAKIYARQDKRTYVAILIAEYEMKIEAKEMLPTSLIVETL